MGPGDFLRARNGESNAFDPHRVAFQTELNAFARHRGRT